MTPRTPGLRAPALAPAFAVALALALSAAPAGAQEEPPQDTTRARILERLERLARPPGADTLDPDTVREQRARDRERPPVRLPGGDSITALLLALQGYDFFRYEGQGADFQAADRILVLHAGEEEARIVLSSGDVLVADTSIVYDEERGRIVARGNPVFTPVQGDPVASRTIIYDLEEGRGTALGARTQYQEGANWYVQGDLPWVGEEIAYVDHATFTSCDLETPHYHFETDELKIHSGRILVARPVRLYFADVPVAWLPFIAQSLARGRRSGLLTPRFSLNDIVRTSQGYERRISNIGFYWAMSDYTDATVAMDWFSDQFIAMTGSVRYNWLNRFLSGQLAYRQYWRENGTQELAFDTRHNWEPTERTTLRVSARYASSTDFVRRNSFDPREVTQSINSQGGLEHRFDWGRLSLTANRREFLSDDRVEAELPSLNLSINPVTFFAAPPSRAAWYNNVTWSGSGRFTRSLRQLAARPDTLPFSFSAADQTNVTGGFNSSLNVSNLSWSQSVNYRENVLGEVPDTFFGFPPEPGLPGPVPRRDFAQAEVSWSTSLGYQQRLIGNTTLTPHLSLQGSLRRSDTISVAESLVAGPTRLSFGASLKSDLYGFYPGFGPFRTIRHKVSPTFDWSYSPEVEPDELQQRVFGARTVRALNTLRFGFNQTWEAKLEQEEVEEALEGEPGERAEDPEEAVDPEGRPDPVAVADTAAARRAAADDRPVTLLALRTSALTYDFVEADSTGQFLQGFQNTSISNSISSDYLRGLTLSMTHDIFDDSEIAPSCTQVGGTQICRAAGERRFDPHLSQVNLSFSLGSESSIFRLLGFLGGGEETDVSAEPVDAPFEAEEGFDETQMIPGDTELGENFAGRDRPRGPSTRTGLGGWRANLSYSLTRPRQETAVTRQMLMGNVTFRPTENWDLSWRTSYDLEAGHFNDHMVRLSRDLHRWEANFDFQQTATGNWTFRFHVSLRDNRDLKFDYEQRELEGRVRR